MESVNRRLQDIFSILNTMDLLLFFETRNKKQETRAVVESWNRLIEVSKAPPILALNTPESSRIPKGERSHLSNHTM